MADNEGRHEDQGNSYTYRNSSQSSMKTARLNRIEATRYRIRKSGAAKTSKSLTGEEPAANHSKSLRRWSRATLAEIKPESPPPPPPPPPPEYRVTENKVSQKRISKTAAEIKMVPYKLKVVIDILHLFPKMPLHIYDDDYADKVSPSIDASATSSGLLLLDENHLYGFVGDPRAESRWNRRRQEEIKSLEALLDKIAKDNLDKVDIAKTKQALEGDTTALKLWQHQYKLTTSGFRIFMSMMKTRYEASCERVVRERKHEIDPYYFHPRDRLNVPGHSANIELQMLTFTEENVNSWSVRDLDDPTIVYTNKGAHYSQLSESGSEADEPEEMEFPGSAPRADQPGYVDYMASFDSIRQRTEIVNINEEKWKEICRIQATLWQYQHLSRGEALSKNAGKNITAYNLTDSLYPELPEKNALEVLMWERELNFRELRCEIEEKLQQRWFFILQHLPPPHFQQREEAHCASPTCEFHKGKGMPLGSFCLNFVDPATANDFHCLLYERVKEDPQTPGRAAHGQMWFCLTCIENLYNETGHENVDVATKARSKWGKQPQDSLWRPSNGQVEAEWTGRLKRAAQVNRDRSACESNVDAKMDGVENSQPVSHLPGAYQAKTISNTGHLGRSSSLTFPRPSRLPYEWVLKWYCKPFIQTYLNYPLLPSCNKQRLAPGITPFAAYLSTFIRPEKRIYHRGFYTLDSYEYYALMKWKNMCTRKTMWEIPQNRAFHSQSLTMGAMDDYDFSDFFGDDCLDLDEPKPGVVLSQILDVEPVGLDDISTVKRSGSIFDLIETRELKPLSEIMNLVSKRVEEAWMLQNPTGLPKHVGHTYEHKKRGQWPPHSFWSDYISQRAGKQKELEQLRKIAENYETIERLKGEYVRGG